MGRSRHEGAATSIGGAVTGWAADEITHPCYHTELRTLSADCYSLAVNCHSIRPDGWGTKSRYSRKGECLGLDGVAFPRLLQDEI